MAKSWLPEPRSQLSLIFQADSQASLDSSDLHKAIDKAGPTLTFIRVRAPYHETPRIIGGYNPNNWKSWFGRYERDAGLFVFNLNRGEKWVRQNKAPGSVSVPASEYGLSFGNGDLVINSDLTTGSARNASFATPSDASVLMGQAGDFFVESIEIYQVILPTKGSHEPVGSWFSESSQTGPPAFAVPDSSGPMIELFLIASILALSYFANTKR